MNRHLRNFAFFLLGFLSMGLAGYASAGWYVDDGYSHSGGNLNRSAHGNSSAGSGATAQVNGSTVEVTRQWSQAMGEAGSSAAASVAVNVLTKIPKAGVVNVVRSLSLPGLAVTIGTQWLFDQGWNQLNDEWQKEDTSVYGGLYKSNWGAGLNCNCSLTDLNAVMGVTPTGYQAIAGGWKVYYNGPYGPTNYQASKIAGSHSYQTATDADILAQMNSLVDAKTADVLRDLAQRNVELQDATSQIQQLAEALSPKITVGTGTKQNADGSSEVFELQEMLKWEIDLGERPAEDPVPVKEATVQTKTTNTYNTDNSVSTKTETTTNYKNSTAPQQEQKTDCDKKPDSIGCSDWGDAPEAPDIGQQEISPSFSWSPFSLPNTCPAPQQLNLHFGTVAMTWQPSCDFATGIRPIVIAFAGLAALYLMFGMKQDG